MKGKYTKNPLKEYNNRKAESEERTKPEEVEEHMATAKAQSFFLVPYYLFVARSDQKSRKGKANRNR
jgi:hypothetical protein